MAGLFASMAVKWAGGKLSALLPVSLMSPPTAAAAAAAASSSEVGQDLEDLRLLERTMRRIHATLHDAEEHWNIREESAKLRLKELKELAYDAEDVVEEYEYEVNRCKVEALVRSASVYGSSNKRKRQEVHDENSIEAGIVPVPNELAVSARKVIERFSEIKDYSDHFSLSMDDGERRIVPDIRSVRQTSSFVFAPRILGREQDKNKVIEKLMSGESSRLGSHMSVLAIVGMGGLGKTTLAQLVYNDPRVCQSFDLCAWVWVSEYFDVKNITRKIISSLTQNNCDHIEFGELQGALVNQIKGKRVFLVLDDVWNKRSDYWELLCMPLLASRRCDIIITTRNEAVARLVQTMPFHNPNCLSPDESWSLFNQTVFVEQENVTPANLVEIGKSIVEKCKGLPLAIKTLGSILRYETDEMKWGDILESELWDLEQSQNEVLPALELSYKHMPIYLKRCFVALSLFPKYCYLDEKRVVWFWKLLDLLQFDGSDNRDEIGRVYFNELVQRSLLQNYLHGQCFMHDLVHDLACFLAGEEFFRLEADKPIEIPQNARYISIVPGYNKSIQISNASQFLRAIITIGNTDFENPEALFLNCKKFRILHVEKGSLAKALLDIIGNMKLLRHFTFTGDEDAQFVLPNSVFQLFNLCTLDFGAYMLRGIGRLTNLHTLPKIHLSRCGCYFNIRELRNMNKIRKLCIYGLCNVSSIEDASEAHLHSKQNLEILELDFNELRSREHTERADANQAIITVSGGQLLESLRPHRQSLRVLRIQNFNCENYPSWLGSSSFSMLTELQLRGCQSQHLPTLGELPFLKILEICRMEYVKHIGREFCSLDPRVKGFRSLVCLTIEDFHLLSEWSGVEDGEFSLLESLWIWSAFELRSLPLVPFSSLHNFTLYDCRNLATFPASATVRELTISHCASLNEIPTLPSLRSLKLLHCPSLVTLGHLPSLSELNIDGPFKEEILYRLLNSHLSLNSLSVFSRTMTSIPLEPKNLPSLTELELFCPNLQYCDALAGLSSLKILNVMGSPQLYVPDLLRRKLEKLYARES